MEPVHVLRRWTALPTCNNVTELTYLLFLKMMQETEQESQLPEGYRWGDLVSRDGVEQLTFYRAALLHLGSEATSLRVQAIFANAQTALKQPRILKKLVQSLDELDWYSAKEEGLATCMKGCWRRMRVKRSREQGNTSRPDR
jgi:type I restriction enzyme M protein